MIAFDQLGWKMQQIRHRLRVNSIQDQAKSSKWANFLTFDWVLIAAHPWAWYHVFVGLAIIVPWLVGWFRRGQSEMRFPTFQVAMKVMQDGSSRWNQGVFESALPSRRNQFPFWHWRQALLHMFPVLSPQYVVISDGIRGVRCGRDSRRVDG